MQEDQSVAVWSLDQFCEIFLQCSININSKKCLRSKVSLNDIVYCFSLQFNFSR